MDLMTEIMSLYSITGFCNRDGVFYCTVRAKYLN